MALNCCDRQSVKGAKTEDKDACTSASIPMRVSFVWQRRLSRQSLSSGVKASFPLTCPHWVSIVCSGDVPPLRSASGILGLYQSDHCPVPSPQLPLHSLPLAAVTHLVVIHSETSAFSRRKSLKPISHSMSSMCNDVTFDAVCMRVITARFLDRG